MSRIGKLPVSLPSGVSVELTDGNVLKVKGPLGEMCQKVDPDIKVSVEDNQIKFERPTDQPRHHGYQLYVAALFPEGAETQTLMLKQPQGEIAGHALGIVRKATVGQRYTYYAGSAWSCYDVRTFREWQLRIEEFLEAVKSPLAVTLSTPQP